jgi:hypothetical protein
MSQTDKDFCPECGTKYFRGPTGHSQRPPADAISNGKATASLVCGIIGLIVFGVVLGVIAVVLAGTAKKEMARAPNRYSNHGSATAGQVLGIIDIVFGALFIWWFWSIDILVF